MNHYPRHIGDIAKDTAHLSQGQFGAYDLLLDWYYAHEKPLPSDKAFLYAITRAKSKAERANTDAVLRWFFTETPEGWRQKRCDEELARYSAKSAKAAASASARWGASQIVGNANASADAMRTHAERNASHEPVASNQKAKGDVGLSPDVAARQAKNSELRKQASEIVAFLNEKAGRTFDLNGANADHVVARLRDGETADDLRSVIALKCRQWRGDPKMSMYLRPETLFNRTKFASYKGELANV